jgi:hypothetical protein
VRLVVDCVQLFVQDGVRGLMQQDDQPCGRLEVGLGGDDVALVVGVAIARSSTRRGSAAR